MSFGAILHAKRILLCLAIAAGTIWTGVGAAQNLQWARRAGGGAGTVAFGLAVDDAGNAYSAGSFLGTATFGPGQPNQTVLTSGAVGVENAFLAKYDSAGSLLWAKRVSGAQLVRVYAVAVDSAGDSHVAGAFFGTATFAPGEGGQTLLTSSGSSDIFVAKYNTSGVLQWAKRAGGAGSVDQAFSIALDPAGNSYLTGAFDVTATFGPGELNQTTLTTPGPLPDVFVAKYNSAGALQWAKQASGGTDEEGRAIAVDAAGNSYVTGYFQGAATFGFGEPNVTTVFSAGAADVFLAKYSTAGALQWAIRAGGSGGDVGLGLSLDSAANVYLTGYFSGSATFGQFQPNVTLLASAGAEDVFVAKYSTAGQLAWARRAGGVNSDIGGAIRADAAGNSFVTGSFRATATFGPGQPNATALTSVGNDDAFVAVYDTAGSLAWVKKDGGPGSDLGYAIAVHDASDQVYVAGTFQNPATFGAGQANQTVLNASGTFDAYVAKYADSSAVSGLTGIGVYNNGQWRLDANRNGLPDDSLFSFSVPGATRVVGDWNGNGRDKIGLFIDGFWFLDVDGNGVWDGGVVDKQYMFGFAGVTPFVGDWNGDGRDKVGVYIDGFWFLDLDGDGVWEGPGVDFQTQFGFPGVTPFVGDWNGDGRDKVGIYINGFWFLDLDGDGVWDGPGIDRQAEFGFAGVTPLIGDWSGDGRDKIGIYVNGFWFLDLDGDGIWDGPASDVQAHFGFSGVTPLVGDWNGDGRDKIAIFIDGFWYLDADGNAAWDGGVVDKAYVYGQAGNLPTTGKW